ncbi:MAG TPA: fibronectin type III domain-containing protein [Vicinamibacterales bacterium]
MVTTGCGKKGPPLPPIVRIPAGIEQLTTRRVGNDVLVTMMVPAENIDKSRPADIGKIDVYAYSGTNPPPRAQFLNASTLVASIPVLPPTPEETEAGAKANKSTRTRKESATQKPKPSGQAAPASAPAPSPSPDGAVMQGASVTVRDRLTPEALVAQPLPALPTRSRPRRPPPPVSPLAVTVKEGPLRRFYIAMPFSPTGRPGPPTMVAEVPLTPIPDAPLGVVADVTAGAVSLSWEPSGGLIGFLLERALPIESSPIEEPAGSTETGAPPSADLPPGPTRYNVYLEIEPLPDAPASAAADPLAAMEPLNPMPLTGLTLSDPVPGLDGRRRCYTVRALRGRGPNAVESEPSLPVCVVPSDNSAPAAPVGVDAKAEAGAITITWEPNSEADLAGYVILRGEAGDATLTPLTGSVVDEPRYVDRDVRSGVRYVYAVQAVDTHLPKPNVSAESVHVEATAP